MANKTEKTIKKNKKKNSKLKNGSKKVFITVVTVFSVIILFNVTKNLEDLFGKRDIEDSKIEYYTDIADEVSEGKVQVSWKDVLAIEAVIRDDDLSEVRKNDSIKIAEKFIYKNKDSEEGSEYRIKKLDEVLDDMNLDDTEKEDVNKKISDLKNVYKGKKLDNSDYRIAFINKMEDAAIQNYNKYGILPSITISQAILESGWGSSKLTIDSNNLFGIKADSRWQGDKVGVETMENYNDKIVANFRSYSSLAESIHDYGKFLDDNGRYRKHGLFDTRFYKSQAQSLEDAGYSTKLNENGEKIYADMLIEVIQNYNLQLIDNKVMKK